MDMNRDRGNRGEFSSSGDWRSGPRQENTDMERRGFSRDRDRDRERDGESGRFQALWVNCSVVADSSGAWRDGDRRNNRDSDKGFITRSTDRFREERDQDFGRSRDDNKFVRRFDGGNRNGGFTRNAPPPRDEESNKSGEPRQRPKLMLTPRTKPVEAEPEKVQSSTSIFGNAKPVDTAARERQIEERLAKDHDGGPRREVSRERKEREDKENANKEKEKEKEKKEKVQEPGWYTLFCFLFLLKLVVVAEKKPEEKEKEKEEEKTPSVQNQKSDFNGVIGVIDKGHPKRNGGSCRGINRVLTCCCYRRPRQEGG